MSWGMCESQILQGSNTITNKGKVGNPNSTKRFAPKTTQVHGVVSFIGQGVSSTLLLITGSVHHIIEWYTTSTYSLDTSTWKAHSSLWWAPSSSLGKTTTKRSRALEEDKGVQRQRKALEYAYPDTPIACTCNCRATQNSKMAHKLQEIQKYVTVHLLMHHLSRIRFC